MIGSVPFVSETEAYVGASGAPTGVDAPALTRRALRTRRCEERARRRARRWRGVAKVGVIAMVGGGIGGIASQHKPVTLVLVGERTTLTTLASSVSGLLKERGIEVSERDLVVPSPTAPVPRDGDVVVRTARELELEIDGRSERVWTTAATVEDALADVGVRAQDVSLSVSRSAAVERLSAPVEVRTPKEFVAQVDGEALTTVTDAATVGEALGELGVAVGEADVVSVPLTETAADGMTVAVTRSTAQDGTEIVTDAFDVIEEEDPTLLKGEKKVETKGRAGERIVTYTATMVEGTEVDREVITEVVVTTPRSEVVKIGTKEPPKPAVAPKASIPNVSVAVTAGSAKAIARDLVPQDDQFKCLVALWDRESHWNTTAANKYSGAYGIPQALPGSKMASAGDDWRTNPKTQIKWGLGYIKGRYDTPCGAWSAFQSKGWY
ncbi:MAG: ubiquitin-like domain-containing protein [Bifidobacteriaceae bacterium]|jgi:uncharacterized protein YabE (DUF348 family)|nr:ubiquitin-like domain-containing protein [Bifidobacteriaceae bacterium]